VCACLGKEKNYFSVGKLQKNGGIFIVFFKSKYIVRDNKVVHQLNQNLRVLPEQTFNLQFQKCFLHIFYTLQLWHDIPKPQEYN